MREGWKGMKIADICEKASSNIALNKIQDIDGDYPIYGASGYIKNVDFYHRDKAYIGVVKDGSGVGRVNTYPPMTSLLGTMQYILPKDGYCLGYVAYALKSLNLASFASGAAIPHIYFRDYGQCEICVPSLQEQERIVAELDLLTGIIDKQKQQLKELDTLAQSIFYDMFGNPNINDMKWDYSTFKSIFKLKSGDGLIGKNFMQGNYPVYGGNGISGYHNKYNKDGDYIIVGRVGAYCGNVRYVKGQFWLTDNAFQALFDNTVLDYVFVCYLLNAINLHQYANQAAQPVISNVVLKDIQIIMPPKTIQREFAKKIQTIESQKESINRSLAESQKLFDYTMDKYFG